MLLNIWVILRENISKVFLFFYYYYYLLKSGYEYVTENTIYNIQRAVTPKVDICILS